MSAPKWRVSHKEWFCGSCGEEPVEEAWNYCPTCGEGIDWDKVRDMVRRIRVAK